MSGKTLKIKGNAMNDNPVTDLRETEVDAAVAEYFESIERGETPDEQAFLNSHPNIAGELCEFLADYGALKSASPLAGEAKGPAPHDDDQFPEPRDPASPDLPIVAGYKLLGVLGRGGAGIVYKALHCRLNRTVALKMLADGAWAGSEGLERFLREAETVAGLHHPNIVQLYDAGGRQGRAYFTMELIDGGSLAQRLRGARQPSREAAALVATVAEAVQAAHAGRVVHRDLKPSNILLTSDGTPKVTDFGLARWMEPGPALTLTGAAVGTPSYMAPEQARGETHTVGPSADVYSLGAILYELITGQPPFRGETAAQTRLQVIAQEPVPPSRLNAAVPRDLETICLKCLEKDASRRYGSAAALAEDLQRFCRDEPVTARRAGAGERLVKWCRRRPGAATALLAAFLLLAAVVGDGAWLTWRHVLTVRAVEAELQNVAQRQHESDWAGARSALERAQIELGVGGPETLRRRIEQAHDNLDLVARLDGIRLDDAASGAPGLRNPIIDSGYAQAFAAAGLGKAGDDPKLVASRIAASQVRTALVAALDDWAPHAEEGDQRWIAAVARYADPDPWRDQVRDPSVWGNRKKLQVLIATAPVATQSVQVLLSLGIWLAKAGGDATEFLEKVQSAHPSDFWANLTLANLLMDKQPAIAVGYNRAALSARPEAAAAYNNLGASLKAAGSPDKAINCFRTAVAKEPANPLMRYNLGTALSDAGKLDEAIGQFRQGLQLDPGGEMTHYNLAIALKNKGQLDQAIAEYQQALQLQPDHAEALTNLGVILCQQGHPDKAIDLYRHALKSEPELLEAHNGLGNALAAMGLTDEAFDQFRQALRIKPDDPLTRGNLAHTLNLKGEKAAAARLYADVLAGNSLDPKGQFTGRRYDGACSAALAGCGHGTDAANLGDSERTHWRAQARQWLRADLAGCAGYLKDPSKTAAGTVIEALQYWQTDGDLAGLRDTTALHELPATEQAECRDLWNDVAKVLKQAQAAAASTAPDAAESR